MLLLLQRQKLFHEEATQEEYPEVVGVAYLGATHPNILQYAMEKVYLATRQLAQSARLPVQRVLTVKAEQELSSKRLHDRQCFFIKRRDTPSLQCQLILFGDFSCPLPLDSVEDSASSGRYR